MAKFYGRIGYAEDVEERPGFWTEHMTERTSRGDVTRNVRKIEDGEKISEDISLNNQISIIADSYALSHFFAIRYIRWMGGCWKVTNVEVQHPRLILTIGGLYHGKTAGAA